MTWHLQEKNRISKNHLFYETEKCSVNELLDEHEDIVICPKGKSMIRNKRLLNLMSLDLLFSYHPNVIRGKSKKECPFLKHISKIAKTIEYLLFSSLINNLV